jgi:hypothetical protein
VDLYGPAPQSLIEADDAIGRLFAPILTGKTPLDIEARMARELKFDPDLWWLSIDDRQGRHLLDLASDPPF